MKASIVYNAKEEPRIFIELENASERKLLRKVDALRVVRVGETDGLLADIAFEIVDEVAI